MTDLSELILHEGFAMPQLGRARTIRVLLPRHYHHPSQPRFPVVYWQDGQNLFDAHTAHAGHWHLRELMARQPRSRQAILVGIDNGGTDRLHEYAPHRRGDHGGQGDQYLEFLAYTLKPFIDQQYRTLPARESTAIAGSSAGGLIAFYAGLQFGEIFGQVGALSPSLWFNPHLLELAGRGIRPPVRYYVAGSAAEMPTMADTLQRTYWALKNGGLSDADIRVVIHRQGQHGEALWARESKPMVAWLLDGPPGLVEKG